MADKAHPVCVGSGSTAWVSPERRLGSDIHLLRAQVPRGRGLTGAAGDRRDRQAAEEEVHGGQKRLQETDRAESGASVGGKVNFIGVRAGRLEERLVLTGRPGEKRPYVQKSTGIKGLKAKTLHLVIHIITL